jgi:AraC-like DNA-binding protein
MTDPLADVLRAVRLSGGIFLDARFTAPWCVHAQLAPEDCKPFLASPAQLVAYHFVIEGRLLLGVEGQPPIEVAAGEIVILPRNDGHTVASAEGLKPISADGLIQPGDDGGLARINHGGGGAVTHIVCGFLGTEETHNPLLATLPPVLKIDIRQGTSRDWVEASVRFAARELTEGKFASSGVMSRLSELLFVEAVRNYASALGDQHSGWLKGVKDPYVGRALALVHGNIAHPWTAEELASEVALSRSAFNDRFTGLVGMPPIRYLTYWRLQTAKEKMREGRRSIAQIASAVGYESEEAFSRAFKREFAIPPARWRDARQDGG